MGYGVKPHEYNGEATIEDSANFAEQKSGFSTEFEIMWKIHPITADPAQYKIIRKPIVGAWLAMPEDDAKV